MSKKSATATVQSDPTPTPAAPAAQPLARIVKLGARPKTAKPTPAERKLAGTYRVIHSNVLIPRPWDEWHAADGSEKPHEPKTITAQPGDEVALGDVDAANMLDAGVIERLDASPSRVNKVWQPPRPMRGADTSKFTGDGTEIYDAGREAEKARRDAEADGHPRAYGP